MGLEFRTWRIIGGKFRTGLIRVFDMYCSYSIIIYVPYVELYNCSVFFIHEVMYCRTIDKQCSYIPIYTIGRKDPLYLVLDWLIRIP